jgi:HSP20 family molecular chaperone IbpA
LKQENKQGGAVYTEQCSDEIFRTMELPADVDIAKVTATVKDGVLTVHLPKTAATKSTVVEPSAA